MANTTWSATDKPSQITLTNGNLTATSTVGTVISGRAADKQIAGKFYWECTCTTLASAQSGVAVLSSTAVLTGGFNFASAGSIGTSGVIRSGNIYVDGASAAINIGLIVGGVVCIAVDCSARLIWYRLSAAGNWNNSASANPATGIGGLAISLGGGIPLFPAVSFAAINDQITANFGDTAFTGAVPAGFTSGFTSGVTSPTNAIASQAALEQFLTTAAPAQVTQVTIEQWATTATISGQAMVTQVALEQWVPAARPTVDLAGNLGGVSHYGKLKYGLKHYSRIDAFVPAFSADITVVAALNLSGDLAPTIVLAADLDVHVNLIELRGDLAPQIALEGALSLLVPLDSLLGSFGFSVVYGASSFISGPLWADSEPCPTPPWAESEPCPPPPWMTAPPCEPVVWSKTRLCNG